MSVLHRHEERRQWTKILGIGRRTYDVDIGCLKLLQARFDCNVEILDRITAIIDDNRLARFGVLGIGCGKLCSDHHLVPDPTRGHPFADPLLG